MTSQTSHPIPITLDQINLVTPNLPATVEFYRLLGIDIPDTATEWQPHHRTATFPAPTPSAHIDSDLDSTEFAAYWGSADVPTGPLLSFRVPTREAVDTLHQRMTAAGHPSLRAPYDAFWGARFAIVRDPAGTAVGIMSNASSDHRTPPPDPEGFSTC